MKETTEELRQFSEDMQAIIDAVKKIPDAAKHESGKAVAKEIVDQLVPGFKAIHGQILAELADRK